MLPKWQEIQIQKSSKGNTCLRGPQAAHSPLRGIFASQRQERSPPLTAPPSALAVGGVWKRRWDGGGQGDVGECATATASITYIKGQYTIFFHLFSTKKEAPEIGSLKTVIPLCGECAGGAKGAVGGVLWEIAWGC